MKLLLIGTILLLASTAYADKKEETKVNAKSTKSVKTQTVSGPPTAPPQLKNAPKSHSFVRHARKLPQPLRPRLRPVPRKASPRQTIIRPKPKAPLRKGPVRKFPRKLPLLKARQTTGALPVRLPAFQNRPIQPIPPLRPAQVVPVERNPRFRRLVTNLRQSASSLRQGFERGNSNLRNSFRTLGSRNPLGFRRPSQFNAPGNQNRRKINLPPIVFKRAEDMPGYEKFTLAEVIYPEDEAKLQARLDNAEDTILVDTPLDIDPRTKNKKSEDKSEDKEVEEVVKKNEKISPDEFGLRR